MGGASSVEPAREFTHSPHWLLISEDRPNGDELFDDIIRAPIPEWFCDDILETAISTRPGNMQYLLGRCLQILHVSRRVELSATIVVNSLRLIQCLRDFLISVCWKPRVIENLLLDCLMIAGVPGLRDEALVAVIVLLLEQDGEENRCLACLPPRCDIVWALLEEGSRLAVVFVAICAPFVASFKAEFRFRVGRAEIDRFDGELRLALVYLSFLSGRAVKGFITECLRYLHASSGFAQSIALSVLVMESAEAEVGFNWDAVLGSLLTFGEARFGEAQCWWPGIAAVFMNVAPVLTLSYSNTVRLFDDLERLRIDGQVDSVAMLCDGLRVVVSHSAGANIPIVWQIAGKPRAYFRGIRQKLLGGFAADICRAAKGLGLRSVSGDKWSEVLSRVNLAEPGPPPRLWQRFGGEIAEMWLEWMRSLLIAVR
jgi:hypothetical protein